MIPNSADQENTDVFQSQEAIHLPGPRLGGDAANGGSGDGRRRRDRGGSVPPAVCRTAATGFLAFAGMTGSIEAPAPVVIPAKAGIQLQSDDDLWWWEITPFPAPPVITGLDPVIHSAVVPADAP